MTRVLSAQTTQTHPGCKLRVGGAAADLPDLRGHQAAPHVRAIHLLVQWEVLPEHAPQMQQGVERVLLAFVHLWREANGVLQKHPQRRLHPGHHCLDPRVGHVLLRAEVVVCVFIGFPLEAAHLRHAGHVRDLQRSGRTRSGGRPGETARLSRSVLLTASFER